MNLKDWDDRHFLAFTDWLLMGGWTPERAREYDKDPSCHCPIAAWLQEACSDPHINVSCNIAYVPSRLFDSQRSTGFGTGVTVPPLFWEFRNTFDQQYEIDAPLDNVVARARYLATTLMKASPWT